MNASTVYSSSEHQSFTLGEGPNKALLLHGFPGTPAELREVAKTLCVQGWQVTAPLLPGFGVNIATLGEKRWGDWYKAALKDWQRLEGAQRTLLVGFSMGGALALHLAAARHARAHRPVLAYERLACPPLARAQGFQAYLETL